MVHPINITPFWGIHPCRIAEPRRSATDCFGKRLPKKWYGSCGAGPGGHLTEGYQPDGIKLTAGESWTRPFEPREGDGESWPRRPQACRAYASIRGKAMRGQ